MKKELEFVLKLALDKAFGQARHPSREEQGMICKVLDRNHWPDDGFNDDLAKDVLYRAITKQYPYIDGWDAREYD